MLRLQVSLTTAERAPTLIQEHIFFVTLDFKFMLKGKQIQAT